ncbi:MAG: manganese-binding transcriptional regulator MntR [Hyphomicrobiaceae bacterium]|nr:manganese-binding transcriptional regulator MntR [Hyphomicrobiaceae bacterium]MCC0023517.1 manganese-binding transcriptional regulator MntR [Hyphomicrobiaceae bacterium]
MSKDITQPETRAAAFQKVRESQSSALFEDYVELIDDLVRSTGEARQVDIAANLGVTQPTVARALDRLAEAGLVERKPYRGVFLSAKGEELAASGRRRHAIVEAFLIDIGVDAETARIDAEGIEHYVSDETLAAFAAYSAGKGKR